MEKQTPAAQEFLTLDEAAAFVRKSVHGFRKLVRARKLPAPIRCGKTPLWHIQTLRLWLQSSVKPGPAAQVMLLGTVMRNGVIPCDGTFKQATTQGRLNAGIQLLTLMYPDIETNDQDESSHA